MKELDFSERACMGRYTTYQYFEDGCEDTVASDDIAEEASLLRRFYSVGTLKVDHCAYEWLNS